MNGVVQRLVRERLFGFIRAADGSEYFFHSSCLEQTTKRFEDFCEGDRVAFTPIEGPKGPRAIEVRAVR